MKTKDEEIRIKAELINEYKLFLEQNTNIAKPTNFIDLYKFMNTLTELLFSFYKKGYADKEKEILVGQINKFNSN